MSLADTLYFIKLHGSTRLAWPFFLSLREGEWTAYRNQWCLPRAPLVGRLPCQSIRQEFVSLVIYDIEGNGQKDNMGGGGMARKAWECQGAVLKPKWVLQHWMCCEVDGREKEEKRQRKTVFPKIEVSGRPEAFSQRWLNLGRSLKEVLKDCISDIIFLWS